MSEVLMTDNPEEAAVQAMVTALRQFERETGVYIPRKEQAARYVYRTAVTPLVAEVLRAQATIAGGDPACGNAMYCHDTGEHDTHTWDWQPDIEPDGWPVPIKVRCPGRDGV